MTDFNAMGGPAVGIKGLTKLLAILAAGRRSALGDSLLPAVESRPANGAANHQFFAYLP